LVPPSARYCRAHLLQHHREINKKRPANDPESTWKWRQFSKWFLSQEENKWCRDCLEEGRQTRSQQTAHIVPHHGDWGLCFDQSNVVPLCRSHHSRRTAKECGFGNKGKPQKKEIDSDDPVYI